MRLATLYYPRKPECVSTGERAAAAFRGRFRVDANRKTAFKIIGRHQMSTVALAKGMAGRELREMVLTAQYPHGVYTKMALQRSCSETIYQPTSLTKTR